MEETEAGDLLRFPLGGDPEKTWDYKIGHMEGSPIAGTFPHIL